MIRSYLPDPAGTAARIQADLAAVGISVTINVYDSNTFLGKVYAGELDLFLLGWGADFMHPDNFLDPGALRWKPGFWRAGYHAV